MHPTTEEVITKYSKLSNDPEMREVWIAGFGKEFVRLAQGDNKTGAKCTNSLFVPTHQQIRELLAN